MQPVDINLIQRFAKVFCFGRKGFSAEEIPKFFSRYQGSVPTAASYSMVVAKAVLFADSVRALSPENQRLALYDLCDSPPASKHEMPSEADRRELLHALVQGDGQSPLGVELSQLTVAGVRIQWLTAASRLPGSPAAAITAARSLLESTCKTVLKEHGIKPDNSGDLGKLYKQVRLALGLDPTQGASQNVHQLVGGLSQTVDGLAGISNKAGDRHGLAGGQKIDDVSMAGLAVHAAGAASLFLLRVHKGQKRGPRR